MSSIVAPLKNLTLTNWKFVEKFFSLIPSIMESPVVTIVLLGQGCASQLYILFSKRSWEIWSNFVVSYVDLMLHRGFIHWVVTWSWDFIILIGSICLACVRSFIAEEPWQFLSSTEVSLTDLNSLKPSGKPFLERICPFLCSCKYSWQVTLEDLKVAWGFEKEISCLSADKNNSMLLICILLLFPSSVKISSIV